MNSIRIALIALLMLQCLHSHAQKYSWYGAVTDSNRQVIYYTNFDKVDENNKDWEDPVEDAEDSVFYAYIKNGTLEVTNNSDSNTTAAETSLLFDYSRDFEIEFRARLEKQYTYWGSPVFWGRDSVNKKPNGQFLYFYASSGYSMAYCTGAKTNSCKYEDIRYVRSSTKDTGSYNTYTVRKIKDMYYVFVNSEYSHRYEYTPLYGQLLGFGTHRKSVANMDYIRVSYLNMYYKDKKKNPAK